MIKPGGLPSGARGAVPGPAAAAPGGRAYIRNPAYGEEFLTPEEALRAASVLLCTLEADGEYRAGLEARGAPGGR